MSGLKGQKKNPVARPDLFSYHDYRSFIRDWLAHQKAGQSRFSMRDLAAKAKLTVGYLSLVLSGKRPLTENAVKKLIRAMNLQRSDASYFRLLVTLGTSDDPAERVRALDGMKRFRSYQQRNPREIEVYRYLTRWFYVAIREMAALPDFKLDPVWIQANLRTHVDLREVSEAVEFLVENGYLEVREDGSVHPPEKSLDCQGGVFRVALSQFHREMFQLAAASIENAPSGERNLLGHAIALDRENFEKANAILVEAFEKIRELQTEPSNARSVYYAQFSFFPLTGGSIHEKK